MMQNNSEKTFTIMMGFLALKKMTKKRKIIPMNLTANYNLLLHNILIMVNLLKIPLFKDSCQILF